MNVTFNPSVNFNSDTNLIAEAARRMQQEQSNPVKMPTKEDVIGFISKQGLSFEEALKDDAWNKLYYPKENIVHMSQKGVKDGNEFELSEDGKVVQVSGWSQPKVIKEANNETAAIFEQIKKDNFKSALVDTFELKTASQEPKSDTYTLREYTQAELNEKANIFAERLKSRKWEKEYLPENDIIVVRQKRMYDGLEYMIKNDGTVMETGLRVRPLVIVNPSLESAKTFAKFKKELDPNAPKTSLWMKGKEAVAGVWKFFTVASTMGIATAKGLWQGALAGAAVLTSAIILKGAIGMVRHEKTLSDVVKSPLKTAGIPGKLLALMAGGLVLTGHLVAGRLEANQKSAVIEHKVDVPHVD